MRFAWHPDQLKLLRVDAAVAILGIVSTLLILFRIVDPPSFGSARNHASDAVSEPTRSKARTHSAIFLALAAAAGIALGGGLAVREERNS